MDGPDLQTGRNKSLSIFIKTKQATLLGDPPVLSARSLDGTVSQWVHRVVAAIDGSRRSVLANAVGLSEVSKKRFWVFNRGAMSESSQGVEVAVSFDADLPMASPLTTSSTRRLRWRPSLVSLDATGCVLPYPRAEMADGETPCSARKSRTLSARRSESCWLKSSEPTLSVWPST